MFPAIPTNISYINSNVRGSLFGKFDYKVKKDGSEIDILGSWVEDNIVIIEVPELIGVRGFSKNGHITLHKNAALPFQLLMKELADRNLIRNILTWDGAFYPRLVRGKNFPSNHSFGTAFDINAIYNGLGLDPACEGKPGCLYDIVPIANKHGFWWGGHYKNRKDGMHFELVKINEYTKDGEIL